MALFVFLGITAWIYFRPALYINGTASMPRGYFIAVDHVPPATGSTVIDCLPPRLALWALRRAYVTAGTCTDGAEPLVKYFIANAIPTNRGLCVRHMLLADTAPQGHDDWGARMPRAKSGTPSGFAWLASQNLEGFDSRYFGAVPLAGMRRAFYLGLLPPLTYAGAC